MTTATALPADYYAKPCACGFRPAPLHGSHTEACVKLARLALADTERANRRARVLCDTHPDQPHPESSECRYPHELAPAASLPSMTATETLDPRAARRSA